MPKKKNKVVDAQLVTTEPEPKTMQVVTPMTLIAKAMEGDFDIDKMTKLYELQQRFESDLAEKSFNTAIALFRAECPAIERTKKGHNNNFAGLAESIEQIKPFTSKHGLSHYWDMEDREDGKIRVICFISHSEGHRKEVKSPWCSPDGSGNKTEIHAIGSIISYLERYTFFAGHGLASKDQDNDGGGSPEEIPYEVIDETQWANLDTMISQSGETVERFCKYFRVKDLSLLPAEKYNAAVKLMDKKLKGGKE